MYLYSFDESLLHRMNFHLPWNNYAHQVGLLWLLAQFCHRCRVCVFTLCRGVCGLCSHRSDYLLWRLVVRSEHTLVCLVDMQWPSWVVWLWANIWGATEPPAGFNPMVDTSLPTKAFSHAIATAYFMCTWLLSSLLLPPLENVSRGPLVGLFINE